MPFLAEHSRGVRISARDALELKEAYARPGAIRGEASNVQDQKSNDGWFAGLVPSFIVETPL